VRIGDNHLRYAAGAAAAGFVGYVSVSEHTHTDGYYGVLADGSWGVLDGTTAASEPKRHVTRIVSLEEVRKHTTEAAGVWVVYGGEVFDVTPMLKEHPGGADAILSAAGGALESFWEYYPIHYRKNVPEILQHYKIGVLSPEDQTRAADERDRSNAVAPREYAYGRAPESSRPANAAVERMRALNQYHSAKVWAVGCILPFSFLLRAMIQAFGWATQLIGGKYVAGVIARALPIAVPLTPTPPHCNALSTPTPPGTWLQRCLSDPSTQTRRLQNTCGRHRGRD